MPYMPCSNKATYRMYLRRSREYVLRTKIYHVIRTPYDPAGVRGHLGRDSDKVTMYDSHNSFL